LKKSNLIEILEKLSSKEFREFGEYIQSQFFNKNESVISLYNYISKIYPEFDKDFDKEKVFKKIFPKIHYSETFMKTVIFNLTRLAEDYLSYTKYNKDTGMKFNYLLSELYDRELEGVFQKKLKSIEKELDNDKIRDADYFFAKYKIQSFREKFLVFHQRFLNYKDLPQKETYSQDKYLSTFYFINIVSYYRFLYNQKRLVNFDFEDDLVELLISYLKDNHQKYNSIQLDLHLYELILLKEGELSYYYKLKDLVIKELDHFAWLSKYSTMNILLNFAMEQYYNGSINFLKERFELYKLVLKYKLYTPVEGGFLKDLDFTNIVTVGLQVKEFEWTEKFINEQKEKLKPDIRDNTYMLSLSSLSFAKGKYQEALAYLSKVGSLNKAYFKKNLKSLTIKIYYELGWDVQAADAVDTYRHFLSRDIVMPEAQKKRSLNFLRFYNELLRLKVNKKKDSINRVNAELSSTPNVVERDWLMEKLEELSRI